MLRFVPQNRVLLISFSRETSEKPHLKHFGGEALGVRQRSCRLCIVNVINHLKAAASLPHSKAPCGRKPAKNAFRDRN
jgi:hypothetical protein